MNELRRACEQVAARARFVRVQTAGIPVYAAGLKLAPADAAPTPEPLEGEAREHQAAFWLTMDAINFGSGWFPTLRKPEGRSGL